MMAMGVHSRYEARQRRYANMTEEEKERQRESGRKRYKLNKKERIQKSSQYNSEIRQIRKELNQCHNCGGEKPTERFAWCLKCRVKNRIYGKKKNKPSITPKEDKDWHTTKQETNAL